MIRWLLVLLTAGMPLASVAAPVSAVLSRSDAESPRLTLSHWPAGGWVVQQFNNLVEIRFPNSDLAIVPEGGLAQGIEGWLAGVGHESTGTDTYLRLTLECDCSVAIQGDGQSALSIEIVGSPSGVSGRDVAVAEDRLSTGPAPTTAPRPASKPQTKAATGDEPTVGSGSINAEEARERLLEQLLKAAEAGIVDLQEPESEPPNVEEVAGVASTVNPTDTAQTTISEGEAADHASGTSVPREVATQSKSAAAEPSRADTGMHGDNGQEAVGEGGGHGDEAATAHATLCFENDAFAYPESLDAVAFSHRVAELRAKLVGEFDRPAPKAALALAKTYLGVGLAHEARALLTGFATDDAHLAAEMRLQNDVAGLLIDGKVSEGSSLMRPDCLGDHALWRGFARALTGDAQGALEDEILSGHSLDRLPLYLRQALSAEIGLAAAETGDWDDVRRLEAAARRAAKSADNTLGQTLMLSARLAGWHDDGDEVSSLMALARSDKLSSSDEATLETARRWLRLQEPKDLAIDDLRRDLGALARRERGTALGAEAFELEARLVANAAGNEDVVSLLAHGVMAGLLPEGDQAALITELVAAPTSIDGREPLALTYLRDPERFEAALEQASFRRSLARSMADIGAPSLAKPVLETEDLNDSSTALALAEGFLDAGQVQDAFDATSALQDGPDKRLAQAAAMLATGQLARAREQLLEMSGEDAAHPKRVALLKKLQGAAIADGKTDLALAAAKAVLDVEGTVATAQQTALLALELDHDQMPADAARLLEVEAPDIFAALELLFRPVLPELATPDQRTVTSYLDELDAEMAVIMEFLQDG